MTVSTPCYSPNGNVWFEHHDQSGWVGAYCDFGVFGSDLRGFPRFVRDDIRHYLETIASLLDSGF